MNLYLKEIPCLNKVTLPYLTLPYLTLPYLNAFPDFGSVGRIKKRPPKKAPPNEEESGTRRPGTPASLPWSLETTRCGYKINMAAKEVEEDKIGAVVKVEIGIQR